MRFLRAFTFSELIIVVAALAILAAAAVPRFIAINSDIRAGAVEALAANVQSSANLTNRIWLSNGKPARLMVDGQVLEMRFGFPTENSISEIVINNGDFVFNVDRDFVRNCQTPMLVLPDDIPAHPYATAMETALRT